MGSYSWLINFDWKKRQSVTDTSNDIRTLLQIIVRLKNILRNAAGPTLQHAERDSKFPSKQKINTPLWRMHLTL